MITLSRRHFLATATAGSAIAGLGSLAFAAPWAGQRCLVVIFLRGGCDALSLVAPVNDPDYVADRPPELRVLADGAKPGRRLNQQLAPELDFRLHPDAAPLADLYEQGQLAVIHAVGLTSGTRSHFAAQALWEHGVASEADLGRVGSGWLSRLLADPAAAGGGAMPAVCSMSADPASLAFHADSLAIPDLQGGLALAGGTPHGALPARDALAGLYSQGDDPFSRSGRRLLTDLQRIDQALPRGGDGKLLPYQTDAKPGYDGSEIGRGLLTIARLLKLDLGLSVAAVDMGGWDQHENMAPRFASCAQQLAVNLAAFWNDLGARRQPVTVLVMSEFGRRLRSNLSRGTDHGHGGVMLALGQGIQGGRMFGRWPGLASHQLDNGVDLAVTTDYRQALGEIVARQLAQNGRLAAIFPDFAPAPWLGLTGGGSGGVG